MGWHRICNGDEGSPFEARDFERIYAETLGMLLALELSRPAPVELTI